jgi:predicted nucleic acid-binding Zn ribbon protein
VSGREKRKPQRLGDVLAGFLERSGLAERVEQAAVVPEWAALVGAQIAAATEPQSITADGTLFVAVRTNAWMTELSLLEPQLLRALNARTGRLPVRRIRWQLMR